MIGPNCGCADLLVLMEFDCFSGIAKLDKTASSHAVLPRLFRFHSVVVFSFGSVLLQFHECEHPYCEIFSHLDCNIHYTDRHRLGQLS